MAILRICRMGHPVLRQKALAVPPDRIQTSPLQQLIDDMIETMADYGGIGLAAPQVRQPLRLVVVGDPEPEEEAPESPLHRVFINPEWLGLASDVAEGWEGCLSLPGLRGVVPRSTSVHVRALDREGRCFDRRATNLEARALQHETDHLDGILFPDRMTDLRTLTFQEEYARYWATPSE